MARFLPKIDPSEIDNPGKRKVAGDIIRLRELHAEMDRAYSWDDLAAHAEPVFLGEPGEGNCPVLC